MSSLRGTAIGNLGQDCEIRYMQDGGAVASFSVATSPYAKKGEPKTTQWVRCSLFGKRAEALEPYLTKGTQVYVFGDLTVREFTGKDGVTRTSLDLRVSELDLLGSKQDSQRPAFGSNAATDDLDADQPF